MAPGAGPLAPGLLLALAALQARPFLAGYAPPAKYVLVSDARTGRIGYARILPSGNASDVRVLVGEGLGHPQGIAVDQKRRLLLVADSDLRKVVSYGLTLEKDGSLSVDEQTPIAEDVEARWVAVDGRGNVFISDEQNSKLLRISAKQVLDGDTAATTLYERGPSNPPAPPDESISNPGGVAVDNFHVYWVNKVMGQKVGTVLRRSEAPGGEPDESVLADNIPKAYGVCIATDNVFYTSPRSFVYGVKAAGGRVTPISNLLRSPRGCAWDGDSLVYVADRSTNAVFSFHNPSVLTNMAIKQVFRFEDAFGVAVYSGASRRWRLAPPWLLSAVGMGILWTSCP